MKKLLFLLVVIWSYTVNVRGLNMDIKITDEIDEVDSGILRKIYVYTLTNQEVAIDFSMSDDSIEEIIKLYTENSNQIPLFYKSPLIPSASLVNFDVVDNNLELDFDKVMYTKISGLDIVSKTFINDYNSVVFKIKGVVIYNYKK